MCCELSLDLTLAYFKYSQKAVRVTTLMKRLRASEHGDSEAPGLAAEAADTPGGAPAPPASIQAPSEKVPDTQTAISALSLPSAARPEEQPPARCNGDVPQMLPQGKGE